MPANVGLAVASGTQLILNMHFINPSSTTMYPQIKINLLFATNVKYQAGTMVSFNSQIDIPAGDRGGSRNADGERELHRSGGRAVLHDEHAHA